MSLPSAPFPFFSILTFQFSTTNFLFSNSLILEFYKSSTPEFFLFSNS